MSINNSQAGAQSSEFPDPTDNPAPEDSWNAAEHNTPQHTTTQHQSMSNYHSYFPPNPSNRIVTTTVNVQKSVENLIRALDTSARLPYVIFVQELPIHIPADKWQYIQKELLPKYGLYIHREANMLMCIHPFWNHFAKDPQSKKSTLVEGLTRSQRITLHFPPLRKGQPGYDLTLVNVYGPSHAHNERPQIQAELEASHSLAIYSGDFNGTSRRDQSTTITADQLVWPFLAKKTGQADTSGNPNDPEWIDCWTYLRPQEHGYTRFKGTWKGHASQSRIDFVFLTATLLPILHPEKCYLVDVGSDHLALSVEFSTSQLPKMPRPQYSSAKSKSEPKPFRYESITAAGFAAIYGVDPPCSIADFKALSRHEQAIVTELFMETLHRAIQPSLRHTTKSRSHHAYSRAFTRAKNKATPAGRLSTVLKKWSQTPCDIDCLEDEKTKTFLTDEALSTFTNAELPILGHQVPAVSPTVIDTNWKPPTLEECSPPSPQTNSSSEFTFADFLEAVNTCDKSPVCGPMRIPTRALSHCNTETLKFLHMIILEFETHPTPLMLQTEILLLHKKGSPFSLGNYRPISLTSVLYRIYSGWLKTRLAEHLEHVLHPSQFGFRPERQIHIQVLRALNAAAACKDPHIILFDIAKAFDSVDLSLLWHQMDKYNIPAWLIRAIKQLYTPATFRVHLASGLSPPTLQNILKGLRQGCPLSPSLFLLYINPLLRKLDEHRINLHPCDATACSMKDTLPTHGGFADDIALVTDPSHIQQALQIFADFCHDFGLHYHPDKTEIASLTTPPKPRSTSTPETDVSQKHWSVTTRDGTIHHFQCLPSTAPPLKFLGVYVHHSTEAIVNTIHRDLATDLEQYRNFDLTAIQRLSIINQVLVARLVYKLTPYPLLLDILHLEKKLLSFLQTGGQDEVNTLCANMAFRPEKKLGAHLLCIHKVVESRFLQLTQGILNNVPHTPPDLHQALSSRFTTQHAIASRLPHLDPVVTCRALHKSLHITSVLNPQTVLENFGFVAAKIPADIIPSMTYPNIFIQPCEDCPTTLSESCLNSLRTHQCKDALETAPLWDTKEVQCFATAACTTTGPTPLGNRLYQRRCLSGSNTTPMSATQAGWASLDCKNGVAFLGRTTGHIANDRGKWQAILFTLSHADPTTPLLILTNHYHATCLHEYKTDRGKKNITKCQHRDLIWKCLDALTQRKSLTRIVWVKSAKPAVIPLAMAGHFAKTASRLPFIPPRPSSHLPGMWILNGLPLELPAASPLLDLTAHHHPPNLTSLRLKHVNLYLSSINLISNPSPKLVTHMHGRVNWENFAWWYEYEIIRQCPLCGEQHATDVFSSLSQCRRLWDITATALCDGYKQLGPSILSWLQSSNLEDRRNFTKDLVPHTLVHHICEHNQMKDFIKARKGYKYLGIINKLYCVAQDIIEQLPPVQDAPSPSTSSLPSMTPSSLEAAAAESASSSQNSSTTSPTSSSSALLPWWQRPMPAPHPKRARKPPKAGWTFPRPSLKQSETSRVPNTLPRLALQPWMGQRIPPHPPPT